MAVLEAVPTVTFLIAGLRRKGGLTLKPRGEAVSAVGREIAFSYIPTSASTLT